MAQMSPVFLLLAVAFFVGLAAFVWLVRPKRDRIGTEDTRPADEPSNSPKKRSLAITALAFLGVFIVLTYGVLNSATDNDDDFEVLLDTPRMINSEMRMDRAYRQGAVLTMEGTMVEFDATEQDLTGFESMMRSFYLKMACDDPGGRQSLKSGGVARFHVNDRNGTPISKVEISENDCASVESGQDQAVSEWPGVRGTPMLAKPEMIEPNVRLEQIFSGEKAMYYVYTRLDVLRHEMDLHAFDQEVRSGIRSETCANPAFQAPLAEGRSMVYIYNDRVGDLMIKITITPDTCVG